jgi:hypothetical protein
MIELIKRRLNEVAYNGTDSIEHLQRIIGAAKFAFTDTWHQRTPRSEDFYIAIEELSQVEAQEIEVYNKAAFDQLKSGAISVLEKLKKSLTEKKLDESDSGGYIFDHPTTAAFKEDLRFALLMVEQQYIQYFKNRSCHLPSQPHDRLFCHCGTGYPAPGEVSIQFFQGDDTPDYIQYTATEAVKNTALKYQKQ